MPVVNPPRRLTVALRNVVKTELDSMVDEQIIEPVTEPTTGYPAWCGTEEEWQSAHMPGSPTSQ